MLRTARSGGVSGMLHRTTVRRADLIEDTVDSLAGGGKWIQWGRSQAVALAKYISEFE
jgi:hypothetical protein